MNKDFCIFIICHGRPDNVITYNTLRKQGYTGKIYIIIDDEDKTADQYYKNFGKQVIMFRKKELEKEIDIGDNFGGRKTTLFVRNACFKIAKDLGIRYFGQYDDDYRAFWYKYNDNFEYTDKHIKNLDKIFEIYIKYFKSIPAKSIAFAQGGDFIGGQYSDQSAKGIRIKIKCMNTFILDAENPFKFIARMNDDVTTYTFLGHLGELFFTPYNIMIVQPPTQIASGGMSEVYKDFGTYVKSFYTVMYCPSFVKIAMMGAVHRRLHHLTDWEHGIPKIINEKYKKR